MLAPFVFYHFVHRLFVYILILKGSFFSCILCLSDPVSFLFRPYEGVSALISCSLECVVQPEECRCCMEVESMQGKDGRGRK